jgi:hypothetical protein
MVFHDSRKLALAWSRLPQGGGGVCSLEESCKSISSLSRNRDQHLEKGLQPRFWDKL